MKVPVRIPKLNQSFFTSQTKPTIDSICSTKRTRSKRLQDQSTSNHKEDSKMLKTTCEPFLANKAIKIPNEGRLGTPDSNNRTKHEDSAERPLRIPSILQKFEKHKFL